MRFSSSEPVPSIYLILILLLSGTASHCAVLERRSHVSSSSSSTRLSHTEISTVTKIFTGTVVASPLNPESDELSQNTRTDQRPAQKASPSRSASHTEANEGPSSESNTPDTHFGTQATTPLENSPNNDSQDRPTQQADDHPPPPRSTTPTSTTPTSTTPTSTTPTSTIPTTTYINKQVTLTYAPNWGDQVIPENHCTIIAPEGDIEWVPCLVFAGTVQLSFFPEPRGSLTFPSTYYDTALSMTLTSPSVYMIIDTLTAHNDCGRLGPTYSKFILPLDLTDVSTMQPYPDATAQNRIGGPRQLTLADLSTDCPKDHARPQVKTLITTNGVVINPHPNDNIYDRCNPQLLMPDLMVSVGLPYWQHCGNDNGQFGIFDPPGAVPPMKWLFPTTTAEVVAPTPTPAEPVPTVQPAPAPTSPAPVPPTQETDPVVAKPPPAASTPSDLPAPQPSTEPADPEPAPAPGDPERRPPPEPQTSNPANIPAPVPSVIPVISSNTLNTLPDTIGSPVDGFSATVGAVTTLPKENDAKDPASVGVSEIAGQQSSTTAFIPSPTGPAEGILTPIATIRGQVISAEPGATTLVVNGQTLSAGGPLITLDGTDDVATLDSERLIIQFPSGKVSTFTIPSAVAAPSPLPTTHNVPTVLEGVAIAALPGGAVLVGTQTVSIGEPAITISGDTVVTLAPVGLIIQEPGGVVSTLPIAWLETQVTQTEPSTSNDVANIIASVMGIPAPTTPQAPPVAPTTVSTTEQKASVDPYSVTTVVPTDSNGIPTGTTGAVIPTYVLAGSAARRFDNLGALWCRIILGYVAFMVGL